MTGVLLGCGAIVEPPKFAPTTVGSDAVALEITSASVPDAVLRVPYGETLRGKGGTAPLTWSVKEKAPALSWLDVDPGAGRIGGTPTERGEGTFVVVLSDTAGASVEKAFTVKVNACTPGATYPCFAPAAAACAQGSAVCTSEGSLGPCSVGTARSQDPFNCGSDGDGSCGTCDLSKTRCENGVCQCGGASCGADEQCCSTDDGSACANLSSSLNHCGSCGRQCDPLQRQNVLPECNDGSCEFRCETLFGSCDEDAATRKDAYGNDATGCEVDFNTLANCGGCSKDCRAGANIDPSQSRCEGGVCKITCLGGFLDCDNDPFNGCERSKSADTSCGSCNENCTAYNGQPGMSGPVTCDPDALQCKATCIATQADCNSGPSNGCETDITTDQNCGACGNACGPDAFCSNRKCCVMCGTKICCGVGCHPTNENACGFL